MVNFKKFSFLKPILYLFLGYWFIPVFSSGIWYLSHWHFCIAQYSPCLVGYKKYSVLMLQFEKFWVVKGWVRVVRTAQPFHPAGPSLSIWICAYWPILQKGEDHGRSHSQYPSVFFKGCQRLWQEKEQPLPTSTRTCLFHVVTQVGDLGWGFTKYLYPLNLSIYCSIYWTLAVCPGEGEFEGKAIIFDRFVRKALQDEVLF